MAKARTNKKIVEKQVVVKEEVVDGVTLDLTLEEANTLRSICGCLSGPLENPDDPRRHTNSIYDALGNVGALSKRVKMLAYFSAGFTETDNIRIEKR